MGKVLQEAETVSAEVLRGELDLGGGDLSRGEGGDLSRGEGSGR